MPARRALRVPSTCCSLCIVALLATIANPSALAQSPRWTPFGKPRAGTVTELAPGAAGRVWATTKTAGLFRSDDGAARWNRIEATPGHKGSNLDLDPSWMCDEIQAIAASPTDPDTAYVATRQNVLRTEDGGATWEPTGISKTIEVIAISPSDPDVVYLSNRRQVWRTDDGGDTWRKANRGLTGKAGSIYSLTVDPHDPLTVYAASAKGSFRSTDGGQSWIQSQGLSSVELVRIVIDPDDPAVLYGAERFDNLWKSVDQGLTWTRIAAFKNSPSLTDLEFDPFSPGTLYLTANGGVPDSKPTGRVLRSSDRGATWTPVLTTELIHDLDFDPQQAGRAYLATDLLGVLRSEDFGATWASANQGLTAAMVFRLTQDATGTLYKTESPIRKEPLDPGSLDIWKSGDGGVSWSPIRDDLLGSDVRTLFSKMANGQLCFLRDDVTIVITPVNDAPVADNDAYSVNEGGTLTQPAPGVLDGDTDPDGDPLTAVLVTGPAHASSLTLNADGSFTYTHDGSETTTDTFTYHANDGTASSNVATVTITINPVNDPPVASPDTADITEEAPNVAALNTVSGNVLTNDTDPDSTLTVSAVAGGAVGSPRAGSFGSVTINSNGSYTYTLDDNNPTVNDLTPGGMLVDAFGYTASDGTLTSSSTLTVTIHGADDPATPDNDAFDFIGNTELRVDLAAGTTPAALETTPSTFGVLDGDVDPDGDPITISGIVGCADLTAPFDCVLAGQGTVSLQGNGRFTFVPEPGDTDPTASFQYTLTGNPAPATVTLTRFERVWYVKNDAPAGGLGRSSDPFDTLTEAQTASLANDYIFVYFGTGTTTGQSAGIALKNGQHLIGEHAGLSLPVNLNANGSPTNLVTAAAGNRPLLDDTVVDAIEGVSAVNVIPTEIVGLNLAGNVNAIDWNTNAAFAGTGALSIRDNVIRSAAGDGVDINLAGTGATSLAFHDNVLTATGTGLDIQETGTGLLTITRFDDHVVSGNTAGTGININNAVFDATPGGGIDSVSGGVTVIGAAGNGVGGSGLVIAGMTGTLAFTDLDIFADSGAGLRIGGTGVATTNLSVGAGVATVQATGGPAVDLSTLTTDLQLTSLNSTNSASTGVALTTVNGTVSAGSGSAITNATGTDFAISGGTAAVTYGGTITDDVGQLVSISGATAGTKSFTGTITDGNDGDGSGISLTGNTGATISFSGGVVLSTGANPAFTATGGGTLRVTGTTNTIATTTGTALNVANTTIHADDLTFRSISSNGAASGIVLNNTGALGGLTVSGTGAAGTGGTIQNTTSHAISLTNTRDVALNWMNIQDPADSGVFGDDLTNFTINNSVINGAGDTTVGDEAGLQFGELLGNCAITNTTVSNSFEDNIRMAPMSGVLTNLAISGSTIGPNPAGTGGNGLTIVGGGTADVTLTVSNTTFTGNQATGFLTSFTDTARHDITITSSTFTGNNSGIQLSNSLSSDLDFDISSNTFLNHASHAILIVPGSTATNAAQVIGTVSANSIGNGTADSGSRDGHGIRLDMRGDATATVAITGNTIRNTDVEGIFVESRLDADADAEVGHLDLTLRDNDAGRPDDNSAFPFGAVYGTRVEARNTTVLCLDIAGNDAENVGAFEDIRLRQRDTSTFRLERFVGNGAVDTDVESFLTGQNPLIDNADATHATTFTGVANGFCAKP